MNNDKITMFDVTLQKTHEWINDVASELEISSKVEAFRALRAVLKALRDQLGTDEAVQLAAQLPVLLRGVYYEGWIPNNGAHVRTEGDFVDLMIQHHGARPHKSPIEMAEAVVKVAKKHISESEVDHVLQRLSTNVRRLFRDTIAV